MSCSVIIITDIILIQLEATEFESHAEVGRERQYLYVLLPLVLVINKWKQMRRLQVCNLETLLTELWAFPGGNSELPFPSTCKCLFIQAERETFDNKTLYFLPQCIYVKEQENRSICNWGFTQLKGKTDSVITAHHWCPHSRSVPVRFSFKIYVSCLYSNQK